ncbi:MAG: hypothetical protein R3D57_20670 [Hyphomicrobiaceae bacterium]
MRVFFGAIGALLGVGLGVWFLGELVGAWIVSQQTLESPDDAASADALGYLVTIFLSLIAGWFIGWWFGGLFSKPEA